MARLQKQPSTPKKPLSNVCRICGSVFSKSKRDKVGLFHGAAELDRLLEDATGVPVREDDGLPSFACTACRSKLWKYQRARRELEETRTWLCQASRQTAMACRFKRRIVRSPGSPSQQHSKKSDLSASPAAPAPVTSMRRSLGQQRSGPSRSLFHAEGERLSTSTATVGCGVAPLPPSDVHEPEVHTTWSAAVNKTSLYAHDQHSKSATGTIAAVQAQHFTRVEASSVHVMTEYEPVHPRSMQTEQETLPAASVSTESTVKVVISYPSRENSTILSPSLAGVGRALSSGNLERLANAIVRVPALLAKVTACLCKTVSRECETLCRPSSKSILMDTVDSAITQFEMKNAASEIAESAPTFWKLLCASACPQWRSSSVSGGLLVRVVMAVACLMKARNQRMSALQYIVSIVLHNSGAKKAAFTRLNRLGLAMSHKSTLAKLRQMAARFDARLLDWKNSIEAAGQVHQQPMDGGHLQHSESTGSTTDIGSEMGDLDSSCKDSLSGSFSEGQDSNATCAKVEDRKLFQITGDNVDFEIRAKYMTLDRRNKSLHWFNVIATDERVIPPCVLENAGPRRSILTVSNSEFFPSVLDHRCIRDDFVLLVSEVVVKYLAAFGSFSQFVVNHAAHDHSLEAGRKSEKHCLGLLELNENKQQDMVEILCHVNSTYVPYKYTEDVDHGSQPLEPLVCLQFGGDQLTAERARNSKKSVINGHQAYQRLDALLPHAEDFHCSMNFVNLVYKKFYNTNSSSDVGTMYQLRNKLDRRDVSSDTKSYRACNSFLQDVLDGYIIASALQHFGMTDAEDMDVIPPGLPVSQQGTWFHGEMVKIVDKFVLHWEDLEHTAGIFVDAIQSGRPFQLHTPSSSHHSGASSDLQQLHPHESSGHIQQQEVELHDHAGRGTEVHSQLQSYGSSLVAVLQQAQALYHQSHLASVSAQRCPLPAGPLSATALQTGQFAARMPCSVASCKEDFTTDIDRRHHEQVAHGLIRVPTQQRQSAGAVNHLQLECLDDHIFNYSCSLMKMALLERNFQDAVHYMDGQRLLRVWKFKMLHFKEAGRTKYALEALLFQADQLALLSPWDAYRQLWNRSFNLRGGAGNNIPLDMMVEHNNNFIKEMIRNQGANLTFQSAQQISRASMGLDAVISNLDNVLSIKAESGRHADVDKRKDVLLIAQEVRNNVTRQRQPREHKAFPKMKQDVLHYLDPSKLVQWVQKHKRALARVQQVQTAKQV